MDVLIAGTGGLHGWPEPGCRCASCLRAAAEVGRRPSEVVIDGGAVTLGPGRSRAVPDARYRVTPVPGGWEVTSPEGERLLYPAGPGAILMPGPAATRYDVVFTDVLGDPFQVGMLRSRGLADGGTAMFAAFADHRAGSARDLAERCAFLGVKLVADGCRVSKDRSEERAIRRVLVLGGARSGKSERAELRVAGEPEVVYVATGPDGTGDPDWAARIAAHRARRPGWWRTAETTDLAGVLETARGALLIDGIGTWLAAVLDECGAWEGSAQAQERAAARVAELVAVWRQVSARVVAVSDETGLGVIPESAAGRLFRDWLGRVNRELAAESEEAELVVAGRAIPLVTVW
jgi:adenosylcobinamide kinase / adenosylcobinamide-phosphate guanylyltransferase